MSGLPDYISSAELIKAGEEFLQHLNPEMSIDQSKTEIIVKSLGSSGTGNADVMKSSVAVTCTFVTP